jgi:hypothetical protein
MEYVASNIKYHILSRECQSNCSSLFSNSSLQIILAFALSLAASPSLVNQFA